MGLPGAERAVIEPAKLRDYLLSSTHPIGRFKAPLFQALGYTAKGWGVLHTDLLDVARTHQAVKSKPNAYGEKYEVRATLQGPNGRTAKIVTVWIVRTNEDYPRLVTAYPDQLR
ncbi:MAG: adhesin [Deltaproteobacteria bacterium]|nr:MAG: adhesin [Deltaproteobacteria bacterium]